MVSIMFFFFFQAEDGIRDIGVTGVQTCALPICRARLAKLTPREFEVFRLVIAGLLNKEIGAELGVALRTIKTHRARVMQKMGVVSVAELVRLAQKAGVAPAPLRWKAARLPFS